LIVTEMQRLTGQVALVTGGAERVGAVICRALAEAGADVAVNHLDRDAAARETVAAIEKTGRDAVALEADISSAEQGRALVERTVAAFGRLDILVHNASTFVRRPFLELTEEDFEESFGVGLRGPFFLSQAAARVMVRQGSGKIISLIGNSLYEAWPDYVSHALAKRALAHLTELLAVALSPTIQCVAIAPDRVLWTSEVHDAHQRGERDDGDGAETVVVEGVAFRTGNAADVARLVVALCEFGPYLNGAVIPLDGGKSRL
jgi:NAD(P)-dependent dehydrogenase (short-subunit alcohol dehydrogenase family)